MAVRLADLLAGLSRLADLGYGLQAGEALRSSALAVLVARSLDLPDDDVRACLYTALLVHVGCAGYAHETAEAVGDETAWNQAVERTDLADPWDVLTTLVPAVMRGRPPLERARVAAFTLTRGRGFGRAYATASCEVGREAARRLGLPAAVQDGVHRSHEWWNGKGAPDGLAGEDIPVAARVTQVATAAVLADTLAGPQLARDTVRKRAGKMLDPHVAAHLTDHADALLGQVGVVDPRDIVLTGEPAPTATVPGPRLADVARVFGDLADLKSPFTHGHAAGVAELARDAGERLGLPRGDVDDLEVAALLHDVGRVAVSDTVWEKPGPLTDQEWEQVRLHAYHSERIVAGSERLAPLVPLVGGHHERCDGKGYHRGARDAALPMACRILAAADAYQAMTQRRPHRPALTPERAEAALSADVRAGRLDAEAASAVLSAAGHRVMVRRNPPGGLTDREAEVLALVADGCSNREIAEVLVISPRTAEQHVQNIYRKIGASSRAAAALFAMEHGLLSRKDP
ncbi:MAG TPA: HD domain-containing phosphohydrolase [Euzebyales bacterium]|nr:HD domain-containing phosphohydrolase [Euzebyales bacterium]